MNLLIVTQVVDKDHPILGFFHRWIEEFAKHCDEVHVICLQEGSHSLPSNVRVYSLGKDEGKGRPTYLVRFFTLIWKLRREYDSVFVHMNQIYIILGAPFWRALGKPVGLWYAHGSTPFSLKVAEKMTNIVFTSTPEGFRLESEKTKIVGQGIDTTIFTPTEKASSEILRLITVGRISRSKNIDTLLRACALLREENIPFHFQIIGVPTIDAEYAYDEEVKALAKELLLVEQIEWTGAVPNFELPPYLQKADVFIHDGATNSLDKTLIEASLCECAVISSNPAYKTETSGIAPQYLYNPKNYVRLAEILRDFRQSDVARTLVQQHFKSRYDISTLISGIVNEY